jgi:hypothetical protein
MMAVPQRDQVTLAQNVGNLGGSVDYEVRTSHRRTERTECARTGAGELFELDDSWPGERAGDHYRRADHGPRASDPGNADRVTGDTDGLGCCTGVPFGAAQRLPRSA